MKFNLVKEKPSEIILENEGAEYGPGDTRALRMSHKAMGGWIHPPIVYRHPEDNRLHCLDGNHRLVILRMHKRDYEIPVLEVTPPDSALKTKKTLLAWRLKVRDHVNSARRSMETPELRRIFRFAQDELEWTQERIGEEHNYNQADVSRILGGKYEEKREADAERQKQQRQVASTIMDTSIPLKPPKDFGDVATPDMALLLLNVYQRAEDGDEDAIADMRLIYWTVGRRLIGLGVELPDPLEDNP